MHYVYLVIRVLDESKLENHMMSTLHAYEILFSKIMDHLIIKQKSIMQFELVSYAKNDDPYLKSLCLKRRTTKTIVSINPLVVVFIGTKTNILNVLRMIKKILESTSSSH